MLILNGIGEGYDMLNSVWGSSEREWGNIPCRYQRDPVRLENIAPGPQEKADGATETSVPLR
jgi:hypothetical protein